MGRCCPHHICKPCRLPLIGHVWDDRPVAEVMVASCQANVTAAHAARPQQIAALRARVYWTVRFIGYDIVTWYAEATAALVAANDGEEFAIFTNCNNFHVRARSEQPNPSTRSARTHGGQWMTHYQFLLWCDDQLSICAVLRWGAGTFVYARRSFSAGRDWCADSKPRPRWE